MYCGCNPIAYRSQKQISNALQRLMRQKPYETISVSELCRETCVSRQTFYSLFSSLENVILFILQENNCKPAEERTFYDTPEKVCSYCSNYIRSNRDILILLSEQQAAYLIYSSLYEAFRMGFDADETRASLRAHYLAGALTGVVLDNCGKKFFMEQETLESILMDFLRGGLF